MHMPLRLALRCLLALALFASLATCGGSDPLPEPTSDLVISGAEGTLLPSSGAVYLRVGNPGSEADTLLRVETPQAKEAGLHQTLEDEGVMRMVGHPEGFAVPAGGSLVLEPGGKHIMLTEPQPLEEGAAFPLTLHFQRAGAVTLEVTVVAPGGSATHHHHP